MGLSNVFYSLLPQNQKDNLVNRKNVKLINEFLRKRKKLQTARKNDFLRLKEMRKNRHIDRDTYLRLKEVMALTHEENRIQLLNSIIKKSSKPSKISQQDNGNSELPKEEETNS